MKNITIKESKTTIKLVAAITLAGLFVAGCQKDFVAPASPTGGTISSIAAANDSLDIFVAALAKTNQASSLDNNTSGTYTVFAPSDSAYIAWFKTKLAKTVYNEDSVLLYINTKMTTSSTVKISDLNTALSYGIISSALPSSQITGAQTFTTLGSVTIGTTTVGSRLSISKSGSNVYLNANATTYGAKVKVADLSASNGVLHIISKVITPPTVISAASYLGISVSYSTVPPTVTIPATNLTNYDVFINAVKVTGTGPLILPNVSPLPEVTVFAPTDAAFVSYLGTADEASAIAKVKAMTGDELANLTKVIQYHILGGTRYLTTDLTDGKTLTTTSAITVNVSGGIYTLTDGSSDSADATISAPNVLTNDGAVQGISVVLRPN